MQLARIPFCNFSLFCANICRLTGAKSLFYNFLFKIAPLIPDFSYFHNFFIYFAVSVPFAGLHNFLFSYL